MLPEYRSRSIGQQLMNTFFDLSYNSFDSVILEVRETNLRAQSLYYRNGFKKIGELTGLYISGELAYRLQKKLR